MNITVISEGLVVRHDNLQVMIRNDAIDAPDWSALLGAAKNNISMTIKTKQYTFETSNLRIIISSDDIILVIPVDKYMDQLVKFKGNNEIKVSLHKDSNLNSRLIFVFSFGGFEARYIWTCEGGEKRFWLKLMDNLDKDYIHRNTNYIQYKADTKMMEFHNYVNETTFETAPIIVPVNLCKQAFADLRNLLETSSE